MKLCFGSNRAFTRSDLIRIHTELAIDADYFGPAAGDDAAWNKEHEAAQEKIRAHLITGQLTATGLFYAAGFPEIVDDGTKKSLVAHLTGHAPNRVAIPNDAWTSKTIEWEHNPILEAPGGQYMHIWVSTAQLLQHFPELPRSETAVQRSGRVFLWEDSGEKPKRRRGPKERWDWALAHVALGILIGRFGIPELQKGVEADLAQIFINSDEALGEPPSVNMIRSYASALMQRRPELQRFIEAARSIAADRERAAKRTR